MISDCMVQLPHKLGIVGAGCIFTKEECFYWSIMEADTFGKGRPKVYWNAEFCSNGFGLGEGGDFHHKC